MKRLLALTALTLALAGPAQAACFADYTAKQDAPLRLHYGVAQISNCSVQTARGAGWRSVKTMPDVTSSATEPTRGGNRIVALGLSAVVLILLITGIALFWSLPDANAFNDRVERIFIENDALTSGDQIKLLEILAQSGTAFSDTLSSYRMVIFVLLVFAAALLIAALVFLVLLIGLNRRMAQVEQAGIQVNSL